MLTSGSLLVQRAVGLPKRGNQHQYKRGFNFAAAFTWLRQGMHRPGSCSSLSERPLLSVVFLYVCAVHQQSLLLKAREQVGRHPQVGTCQRAFWHS